VYGRLSVDLGMISQLIVLSPRGDVIILKDFKGNVSKSSHEVLFKAITGSTLAPSSSASSLAPASHPPVFCVDGTSYAYVCGGGLYWGLTTRENVSPSLLVELLNRLFWVANDYVGHVSEESVRKNFVLLYELIDEIMDYGFPQNSSTERLKEFIAMEPSVSSRKSGGGLFGVGGVGGVKSRDGSGSGLAGPKEVVKSVLSTSRTGAKEEIFVDIVEKLTAIFDASGRLRTSSIVGSVQVKSYLHGSPKIRLGLPESLVLLSDNDSGGDALQYGSSMSTSTVGLASGPVVLDTYSLHESVDRDAFSRSRVLELTPPEGHFSLLTYRSSKSFVPPFVVTPMVEEDAMAADKMTVHICLRADYEGGGGVGSLSVGERKKGKTATGVEVILPLPPTVSRAHVELDTEENDGPLLSKLAGTSFTQKAEWNARDSKVVWSLRNVPDGREHVLKVRLTVDSADGERGSQPDRYMVRHEMGPIMVHFVLPGKPTASGIDVNYMKIMDDPSDAYKAIGGRKKEQAARWFRSVCMASTYLVRTD